MNSTIVTRTILVTLCCIIFVPRSIATTDYDQLRNRTPDDLRRHSDKLWDSAIRIATFREREINESQADAVIDLKVPLRPEDATLVPVSIRSKIAQTPERYIKKLHVYLDKNPLPLVGVFEFTPNSGRADLAMRVRVNDNTFFRVVTEMNSGELLMSKSFVRPPPGGCSAPLGASVEESLKRIGKMKMNILGDVAFGKESLMQLKISHPNLTGMATGAKSPPHFISALKITYDNTPILTADLTFSISQDPSFRFFFTPEKAAEMVVEAQDNVGNTFTSAHFVELVEL